MQSYTDVTVNGLGEWGISTTFYYKYQPDLVEGEKYSVGVYAALRSRVVGGAFGFLFNPFFHTACAGRYYSPSLLNFQNTNHEYFSHVTGVHYPLENCLRSFERGAFTRRSSGACWRWSGAKGASSRRRRRLSRRSPSAGFPRRRRRRRRSE